MEKCIEVVEQIRIAAKGEWRRQIRKMVQLMGMMGLDYAQALAAMQSSRGVTRAGPLQLNKREVQRHLKDSHNLSQYELS